MEIKFKLLQFFLLLFSSHVVNVSESVSELFLNVSVQPHITTWLSYNI